MTDDVRLVIKNNPDSIKDEMLKVTASFLKKGRRYFGKAAVGLQNQLDDPKYKDYNIKSKLIEAGISGEKKTSLLLREWIADKKDCVLIDSISLPLNDMEPEEDGEEGQLDLGDTDHLLIIGNNIIVIDSKNWKSKTTYQFNEHGDILRGKKPFPGNRPRIKQCKYLWNTFYNDVDIEDVKAYVCISSPDPFIVRDRNWWRFGFKLVNQETLIYFLNKMYEEDIKEKGFIRVELVAKALTGLNNPYNKYKEKFGTVYKIVTNT